MAKADLRAFESIVRLKPGLLGPCYTWRANIFTVHIEMSEDVALGLIKVRRLRGAKVHLFGVYHGPPPARPEIYQTSKCGHAELVTCAEMSHPEIPDGIPYCTPCLYYARKREELRRWEMRLIERCQFSRTPDRCDGKRVDTRALMGKGGQGG